ncbi:MAG TPA: hypothetical protein VIQ30_02150 [Pseudonocardia sp.]
MGALEKVPGVQNWIDRLPAGMRAAFDRSILYRCAVHLHQERGMSVGHALASAINWTKYIARTGDVENWPGPRSVRPSSVAECVAAVALWEAMKSYARSHKG